MELGSASMTAGFIFIIYFLPSAVGYGRDHHNLPAIVMLNLLLGWTLLGWVLALVWACTATGETSGQKVR